MCKLVGGRRYVIFLIGFLDLLAVSLIVPALPVYLKSLSPSSTLCGLVGSIYGALQLFSSPIVGKWSDKSGRMEVLSICLLVCSAGYISLAYFMQHLVVIAILRVIPGIFKHTQDISRCLLLEDKNTSKNEVLGIFNALSSIGFIIGPSVHGHLVDRFGLENGFLISCVMCFFIFLVNCLITIVFGFFFGMGKSSIHMDSNANRPTAYTKSSKLQCNDKHDIKISAFHYGVLASRFFMSLGVMMFRSSFVLWLIDCHPELSSTRVGYILSYNGTLGLICGFIVTPLSALPMYRNNEEKMQLHASILSTVAFLLLTISNEIPVVIFMLSLLTMSTAVMRVCGIVISVKHIPKDNIGRVNGLGSSIISVARFAAPLAVGVTQEVSFSAPGQMALLFSAIGTAVYYRFSYSLSLGKDKRE